MGKSYKEQELCVHGDNKSILRKQSYKILFALFT